MYSELVWKVGPQENFFRSHIMVTFIRKSNDSIEGVWAASECFLEASLMIQ